MGLLLDNPYFFGDSLAQIDYRGNREERQTGEPSLPAFHSTEAGIMPEFAPKVKRAVYDCLTQRSERAIMRRVPCSNNQL
jgi:hypothetical protein